MTVGVGWGNAPQERRAGGGEGVPGRANRIKSNVSGWPKRRRPQLAQSVRKVCLRVGLNHQFLQLPQGAMYRVESFRRGGSDISWGA